ncbi:hypothetical protein P7K49_001459, partial [Saguinus oedipus]
EATLPGFVLSSAQPSTAFICTSTPTSKAWDTCAAGSGQEPAPDPAAPQPGCSNIPSGPAAGAALTSRSGASSRAPYWA